jgi:hypothetical protein
MHELSLAREFTRTILKLSCLRNWRPPPHHMRSECNASPATGHSDTWSRAEGRGVGGWTGEARISVEATPRPQAHEDLARTSLQPLLELYGIVASVEDEQRSGPLFLFPVLMRQAHERSELL